MVREAIAVFLGRSRFHFQCVTLLLVLGAQTSVARDWAVYSSTNFTIYSDRKESEVLRMLEEFEVFRTVALEMIAAPDQPENERLKIFLFDRNVDYHRIQRVRNIAGFFYHGISGPRMIVSPEGSANVLFHEYVHYLMDRHSNANYPRWYSEGLASVLESMEIREDLVRVGLTTSNFEMASVVSVLTGAAGTPFDPAPISDMIALESRVGAGDFYATAWLMTHFFLIDSVDVPERMRQTADYLLRFDSGEEPEMAFANAFGVSPREMDGELDAYNRTGRFKTIVFPGIDYPGGFSSQPLTEVESMYLLADLSAEVGRSDTAEGILEDFRKLEDSASFDTRMLAIEAVVLGHEEKFEEGDALFDQLISLGVDDPEIAADVTHYAVDRMVHARQNDEDLGTLQLERAIQMGTPVARANPAHVETLFFLGRAHELIGNLRFGAEALLQFIAGNPTAPEAHLLLAKIFVVGGNAGLGMQILDRVYSATHSDEIRTRIDEIRGRLDDPDFVADALERLISGDPGDDSD